MVVTHACSEAFLSYKVFLTVLHAQTDLWYLD
ncbi:hypothetical protein HNQ65_001808 [Prosthecobacter vanneervenii]|uniref:Uncharacterized protein n=1 Tax=Prosthecobacter vanneervenii TaxID=48466 RepID=A0A7W7Y9R6_9BACT|nr:hypothetical protein [Prosthecobacter vanneervenii]